MMPRVRPAHETTTRVSGDGDEIGEAVDQLGAGAGERARHVKPRVFVERAAVEDGHLLSPERRSRSSSSAEIAGVANSCSMISAKALLGTLVLGNSR